MALWRHLAQGGKASGPVRACSASSESVPRRRGLRVILVRCVLCLACSASRARTSKSSFSRASAADARASCFERARAGLPGNRTQVPTSGATCVSRRCSAVSRSSASGAGSWLLTRDLCRERRRILARGFLLPAARPRAPLDAPPLSSPVDDGQAQAGRRRLCTKGGERSFEPGGVASRSLQGRFTSSSSAGAGHGRVPPVPHPQERVQLDRACVRRVPAQGASPPPRPPPRARLAVSARELTPVLCACRASRTTARSRRCCGCAPSPSLSLLPVPLLLALRTSLARPSRAPEHPLTLPPLPSQRQPGGLAVTPAQAQARPPRGAHDPRLGRLGTVPRLDLARTARTTSRFFRARRRPASTLSTRHLRWRRSGPGGRHAHAAHPRRQRDPRPRRAQLRRSILVGYRESLPSTQPL